MLFRFAPRDGTRYTCVSSRERNTAGATDITHNKEDVLIRRAREGYQVIATPVSLSASRNGEPIDDALQDLAATMIVIYEVDQNGRLTGISGTDITDKLQRLIPEPIRPAVARMFSREALFARNKAEWDARYADLNGRELNWGSSFDWTSQFVSPNGMNATFWGTTVLMEEVEDGGRHCCKLRYAYGSNPAGLRELTDRLIKSMEIRSEMSRWELAGEGERTVEPDTMMIHSESLWRKGTMAVMMPGIGRTAMDFEETTTWASTYGV
jgi:hypothetical protein